MGIDPISLGAIGTAVGAASSGASAVSGLTKSSPSQAGTFPTQSVAPQPQQAPMYQIQQSQPQSNTMSSLLQALQSLGNKAGGY